MTEFVQKYVEEEALPMKVIFKDMAKYAPSKIFGIMGNTVLVPIYTNLLNPEQYGIYTIAIAMLSFLCIIFSDWVGLSGLRFFKEHNIKDQVNKYLSTLVGLLAINIFAMFIIALIFRHNFYSFFKISPKLFLIILLLVIPVAIRALLFQILRAQIKPGAYTLSTIINQILTILISVFIIKTFHLGGISILIGMVISVSIIDLLLIFQSNIFSYFKIGFGEVHFDILKPLFSYGVPLAITSISMWFITQSNKFILQYFFKGFKEVGLVGVAYSLTFPILMTLFAIITIAAVPRIINLYEEKKDVTKIISRLTGYFALIALPIIIVVSTYPKEIVSMLANQKFADAYVLIPYLAFSTFFLSLTDYTTLQYHLVKKTYINTIIKVSTALVGILLNFVLIKKMGVIGVGVASLATNIMYFILSVVVVMPNHKWQIPYKQFLLILASFIPCLIAYFVFSKFIPILAIYQMISLMLLYYFSYWTLLKITKLSV